MRRRRLRCKARQPQPSQRGATPSPGLRAVYVQALPRRDARHEPGPGDGLSAEGTGVKLTPPVHHNQVHRSHARLAAALQHAQCGASGGRDSSGHQRKIPRKVLQVGRRRSIRQPRASRLGGVCYEVGLLRSALRSDCSKTATRPTANSSLGPRRVSSTPLC